VAAGGINAIQAQSSDTNSEDAQVEAQPPGATARWRGVTVREIPGIYHVYGDAIHSV